MEATQSKKLATFKEVMTYLKISESTLKRLKNDGELGEVVYLSANMPRIKWAEVHNYEDRKINETEIEQIEASKARTKSNH